VILALLLVGGCQGLQGSSWRLSTLEILERLSVIGPTFWIPLLMSNVFGKGFKKIIVLGANSSMVFRMFVKTCYVFESFTLNLNLD
jgi:hypothetical protein